LFSEVRLIVIHRRAGKQRAGGGLAEVAVVQKQISIGKQNIFACTQAAEKLGAYADVVQISKLLFMIERVIEHVIEQKMITFFEVVGGDAAASAFFRGQRPR